MLCQEFTGRGNVRAAAKREPELPDSENAVSYNEVDGHRAVAQLERIDRKGAPHDNHS
jgi:hypothetical protein